jgi:hypothetical protein
VTEITNFGDVVEGNGKSIRQNNSEQKHKFPIDTLVEVKYERWHSRGACEKVHARLFVVWHQRDCDGSPLYHLSSTPTTEWGSMTPEEVFGEPRLDLRLRLFAYDLYKIRINFGEHSLTPVTVTPELIRGEGELKWEEGSDV